MKILITDGYKKANFLIGQLLEEDHEITFIHEDVEFAEKILNRYNVDIYTGDASVPKVFERLENDTFDVLIAMSNSDHRNYCICALAGKLLKVKKRITLASNPNNQQSLKQLGIEVVMSASHLITNMIKNIAVYEDAFSYISLEDQDVRPFEVSIREGYAAIGKEIKDIKFPQNCVVCTIVRQGKAIIPSGSEEIFKDDKVVIFTDVKDDKKLIQAFK